MKVAIFSTHHFEKPYLDLAVKKYPHEITYFDINLLAQTAQNAKGFDAVCCFVSDQLNKDTIKILAKLGVKIISLRSAGFNHVDLQAAKEANITVTRVPAYSPYAVAEFAVGLILSLNRKIHKAYNRTREHNFSLDGLLGFDLHGSTIGVIGTGKIGSVFSKIMLGFGCKVLATDPIENPDCLQIGVQYVSLQELCKKSDVISLHCPYTPKTKHLINANTLELMKPGVMIINTGRGALIDTKAVIKGLKTQKIGYLGLDVYEEEENLFFRDLSEVIITDDIFMRLLTFPNVLITGHQAFFTKQALNNIELTSLANITAFEQSKGEIFIVSV
ncbi:MAG: 2-hydroxyacid dehydrogenase [Gammaproteobacteria bacterium]